MRTDHLLTIISQKQLYELFVLMYEYTDETRPLIDSFNAFLLDSGIKPQFKLEDVGKSKIIWEDSAQ